MGSETIDGATAYTLSSQYQIGYWQDFKNTVDSKQLLIQYEESELYYYLFAVDDPVIYTYRLEKGTNDAVDFEQNYKPYANRRISGEVVTYTEKPLIYR